MSAADDGLRPLPFGGDLGGWTPVAPLFVGRPPVEEGWARVADLADLTTGRLASALAAMAEARAYPSDDGRTLGSAFVLITAGALAGAVARLIGGDGMIEMPPTASWWRLRPAANVMAVAVEAVTVAPAPPLGEATAADLAGARTALRTGLDPLYAAVHQLTRIPARTQWALAASVIGQWLLQRWADDEERAVRAAEALFDDGDVLWRARPRVWRVEWAGRRRVKLTRRACCYNFNGRSGQYCTVECPLLPPAERARHALAEFSRDLGDDE